MGVWIEIMLLLSHVLEYDVTPFMGVWIEIFLQYSVIIMFNCHSLYGSVD